MIIFDGFSANITVVGGDRHFIAQLHEMFESKEGWNLESVTDVDAALTGRESRETFVALVCVRDDSSFAQAVRFLRQVDSSLTRTIVVHDSLESSQLLELFRRGAVECLARPVSLTRLSLVLDMLAAPKRAARSIGHSRVAVPKHAATDNSISGCASSPRRISDFVNDTSPAHDLGLAESLIEQVRAVAPLDTTVLITGETGVGKTRLSRLIHAMSPRKDKPFVAVNCGALAESLLDSDLFGHVKGAFTGADYDHDGKLTQCRDGTLLLDEIDSLSPAAQVKLLHVADDRVFQPVGSTKFLPLRARLIVASNKSLEQEVADGRFRSDLFYRLNVMSFQLPPLRERHDETRRLVNEFVAEFASHHGMTEPVITGAALSAIDAHTWPGNIRELRNVIERAVILSGGRTIDSPQLPTPIRAGFTDCRTAHVSESSPHLADNRLVHARGEAERAQLLRALLQNDNNRTKTAAYLGISRVALYKRLRKFQIV